MNKYCYLLMVLSIVSVALCLPVKSKGQPILSNANDVSVTISWISNNETSGSVAYGMTPELGDFAYDVRGETFINKIHYVQLSGLLPETMYYFDLITEEGRDDNAGMHYSFTTGPISEKPPLDDTVYGQAVLPDGITPANGALVYVTIYDNDGLGSSGHSTTLSSLVEEGYWDVQLANSRLLDMSIPFQYSAFGDILQIKIYTPDGFILSTSLDTGNDSPAPILQTEEICTDEICDFIDNDCDGLVDEEGAQGCIEYFMDNDGDGYGVDADFLCLCASYEKYRTIQGGDTDDTDPTVPVAGEEECKFSASIMATGLDLGESKESVVIIGIGNFAKTISLYSEPLQFSVFIKIRDISNPPDYYYQDIRLKGNDSEKWIIQVDVPTDVIKQYPETYPPLLSWDVSELYDIGCFSLWSSDEDGNLLSLLVGDMILEESYQMQKEDMDYIAIVWSKEMTTEMNLPKGWSMISLPIRPGIGDVTTIFPGAVVLYKYQKGAGYVRVTGGENLEVGIGYWILLDNPQSYVIEGTKRTEYTIPVSDGWYMIGGCLLPADKMVTSGKIDVIYSYAQDKGYTRLLESQPLERCKGYWIKFSDTSEGTKFTASTSASK